MLHPGCWGELELTNKTLTKDVYTCKACNCKIYRNKFSKRIPKWQKILKKEEICLT